MNIDQNIVESEEAKKEREAVAKERARRNKENEREFRYCAKNALKTKISIREIGAVAEKLTKSTNSIYFVTVYNFLFDKLIQKETV